MQKKHAVTAFVVGFAIAATAFSWRFGAGDSPDPKLRELEATVTTQRNELLGYTRYTDYLHTGKQKLQEQMKFIAATVVREEGYTRLVKKSVVGLTSDSVVAISYTAEYSFGYDLKPGSYEITATDRGINVILRKPVLIASPASRNLRHQILSGGLFADSKAAVIGLYQDIGTRTQRSGSALASDEAVMALCEKNMLAFLRDFFAKQPGVKHIPNITITYKT